MPHPDEGLIHAWLDGELDAAEAARIEALVASDPEWAAAAADARGLIAASARIVGALDRVPANVVPSARQAPRKAGRQWMWRAAAAVVLIAGSAVVLQRGTPELPSPSTKPASLTVAEQPRNAPPTVAPAPARGEPALTAPKEPAVTAAKSAVADARRAGGVRADSRERGAAAPSALANATPAAPPRETTEDRSTSAKKELEELKQKDVALDKTAASAGGLRRSAAGVGGSTARAANAPAAQQFATEKSAVAPLSCFEQRTPRDSANRIIRLAAGALDDSIRLEKLTLRGDTLAAVRGAFTALRVRCPAP